MISKMHGILDSLSESSAVLSVNGIFYDIMLPSALVDKLRSDNMIKSEMTFYILDYIEGGQVGNQYPRLVGFKDAIDREFFGIYTSVPGLGIKKALKSLTIPISEISRAIETEDVAILKKLSGVGERLAEKIIAHLKGKTARFALAKDSQPLAKPEVKADHAEEALAILIQLQYRRTEAQSMLNKALSTGKRFKSSEELLQQIFKQSSTGKIK